MSIIYLVVHANEFGMTTLPDTKPNANTKFGYELLNVIARRWEYWVYVYNQNAACSMQCAFMAV